MVLNVYQLLFYVIFRTAHLGFRLLALWPFSGTLWPISLDWDRFHTLLDLVSFFLYYKFFLDILTQYFFLIELFESAPRPAAMSLGSLSSWTGNFIVGMAFPSLQEAWGAFVFLPFAIACFLLFALLRFYLPETRGQDSSVVVPLVRNGFKSKPLLH